MQRQRYTTDLTDAQWESLEPSLSARAAVGRPRKHDIREVVNALSFMISTGCQWRNIPNDFPPWKSVNYYFMKWRRLGTFEQIEIELLHAIRVREGRNSEPSAGIMDAQAVDCPTSGDNRGYDKAKNVKGRKRHILTDVLGLVLALVVTGADVSDRNGAELLFQHEKYPQTLLRIWADKGYRGPIVESFAAARNVIVEIVDNPSPHEFVVAKRRWVVERTNAWLSQARRLTVDREKTKKSSISMIFIRLCILYSKWKHQGMS
jgi:putative transposase